MAGGSALDDAELIAFRVTRHGVVRRFAHDLAAERSDSSSFLLSIGNRDIGVPPVVVVSAIRNLRSRRAGAGAASQSNTISLIVPTTSSQLPLFTAQL